MKTREDLNKELLYNLKNRIEVWKENKAGVNIETAENEIKLCHKVIANIEEATSIVAVRKAVHLLELYGTDQMHIAYKTGGIKEGDEIDTLLNNLNIPKSSLLKIKNTELWDECVQRLYETMGFEGKLPTHSEIKELEYQIEKLRLLGADENKIIDLEEQLNLKKCALGELTYQMQAEIPYHLSADVKHSAQQERKINAAVSKITR